VWDFLGGGKDFCVQDEIHKYSGFMPISYMLSILIIFVGFINEFLQKTKGLEYSGTTGLETSVLESSISQ